MTFYFWFRTVRCKIDYVLLILRDRGHLLFRELFLKFRFLLLEAEAAVIGVRATEVL